MPVPYQCCGSQSRSHLRRSAPYLPAVSDKLRNLTLAFLRRYLMLCIPFDIPSYSVKPKSPLYIYTDISDIIYQAWEGR